MADASGPSGGGYDYVQDSTNAPNNPRTGQEWYQPDTDDVKTYDGGDWVDVKISDHGQLSGVGPGDHFSPGSGLTFSAGALELLLSGYLELDGNGDLAISAGSIGEDRLGFDTATQNELTTHVNDESNPHNVTDDQTGAQQALNSHASDESNPHNVTDDQTGAQTALNDHAEDADAHHSAPTTTKAASNVTVPAGGQSFVSISPASTPYFTAFYEDSGEGALSDAVDSDTAIVYNNGDIEVTGDLWILEL